MATSQLAPVDVAHALRGVFAGKENVDVRAWDGFTRTGGPHILDRTAAAAIDWDDDEKVAEAAHAGDAANR